MDVSLSMYSLASTIRKEKWSIIDFLDYARSISVNGVELLDIYWEKNIDEEIMSVKSALDERNLQVSAYDVSNNFVKSSSEERALEVKKVLDGIERAKMLGTKIVRVFCGDINNDVTYENGSTWIVDSLKECAKVAQREQIYLAIENHGLLAGTSSQVNEIIKAVDSQYVKSTFDTGNFLLVHEKPEDAFDSLKDEIIHVHFKDFREKFSDELLHGFRSTKGLELIGVIPGDGEVDLTYIVNGLKKISYDGWLSIEYEGHDDAKIANEDAVIRLRNLLK